VDDRAWAFSAGGRVHPCLRHLQENPALPIAPGGPRPADALLRILSKFIHDRCHDTTRLRIVPEETLLPFDGEQFQ
jgi:hypothetical protein